MKRLGRPKAIRELVEGGVIIDTLGAYLVNDYLEHQRSREEIAAFRAARSDIGKKGNHTRWHVARRRFDPDCEFCASIARGIANGSQEGSLNHPRGIADTD